MTAGSKKLNIKLVGCDTTNRPGCDITPIEDFIAKLPDLPEERYRPGMNLNDPKDPLFVNVDALINFCCSPRMQDTLISQCNLVCCGAGYNSVDGYTVELTDASQQTARAMRITVG